MRVILRMRERKAGPEVVGPILGLALLILALYLLLSALECESPQSFEAFPGFENTVHEEWIFCSVSNMSTKSDVRTY